MQAASKIYHTVRMGLFGFVKYRLHLSVVFMLLLYGNNLKVNEPVNVPLLMAFFFWHFSLFLFDRIYDRNIDKQSQPDEYVKEHLASTLYILVALMMVASFTCYWFSDKPLAYWFYLLPITFMYPLRCYKNYRVKSIFLVKNLYSALLIYVIPVYIHTILITHKTPDYTSLISLGIYVLIGEIFWDIRDITADKENNTHTIPNTIGVKPTKLILLLLMATDYWVKGFDLTTSAYIYLILLIFIHEKSDRLLFHVPPLLALVNFLL